MLSMSRVSTELRTAALCARGQQLWRTWHRSTAAPVSDRAESFTLPTSTMNSWRCTIGQTALSCKRFESSPTSRLGRLRPIVATGGIPSVDHGGVVGLKSLDEPQVGLRLCLTGRPEQRPTHFGLVFHGGLSGDTPAFGHVQTLALGVSRGGLLLDQTLGLQLRHDLRGRRSCDAELVRQLTTGDAVIAEDQPAHLCFEQGHGDAGTVITRYTPAMLDLVDGAKQRNGDLFNQCGAVGTRRHSGPTIPFGETQGAVARSQLTRLRVVRRCAERRVFRSRYRWQRVISEVVV